MELNAQGLYHTDECPLKLHQKVLVKFFCISLWILKVEQSYTILSFFKSEKKAKKNPQILFEGFDFLYKKDYPKATRLNEVTSTSPIVLT